MVFVLMDDLFIMPKGSSLSWEFTWRYKNRVDIFITSCINVFIEDYSVFERKYSFDVVEVYCSLVDIASNLKTGDPKFESSSLVLF